MDQYIKINSDNSVKLLGKKLFNNTVQYDVLYTGYIPNGDFLIWNNENNTIEEDSEKRKSIELLNIRTARDQLLQDTDWVVIKSLESGDIDPEWIEYRQKLRDLPSQYSLTGLIDLPTPPISGLNDSINSRDLQPYTIKIIQSDTEENHSDNQYIREFYELDEDYISAVLPSESGILETSEDEFDYSPSGITGSGITKYIANSELNNW
jgi:hypothetical protein